MLCFLSFKKHTPQKGYCKPAELQEAEEAGETFEAGEDAGMGEGQGSKDVSDQIEDESQVCKYILKIIRNTELIQVIFSNS